MKIIGADQRLSEPRGVKILLIGPTGVGKTSQLHTLDPNRVLFVDGEAGDLSVQDVPVDTIRIDDWATARNSPHRRVQRVVRADQLLLGGALQGGRGRARNSRPL